MVERVHIQLLLATFAAWVARIQVTIVAYLIEEGGRVSRRPSSRTHHKRRHGVFASRSRFRWCLPDPPERFLSEGVEAPVLLRPGKEASGSSVDNSGADPKVEPEAKDPEHPKRYGRRSCTRD